MTERENLNAHIIAEIKSIERDVVIPGGENPESVSFEDWINRTNILSARECLRAAVDLLEGNSNDPWIPDQETWEEMKSLRKEFLKGGEENE